MKIKGRKNLETKIKKIVREFIDIEVYLDTDFCFYSETNVLTFAPLSMGELEEIHIDWIKKTYKKDLSDPYIYWFFSLLHEVGHAVTLWELTDEDLEFEYTIRTALENGWIEDDSSEVYFNLPAEKLATEWALDTIYYNKKWAAKKIHRIYESLNHFYKKNS